MSKKTVNLKQQESFEYEDRFTNIMINSKTNTNTNEEDEENFTSKTNKYNSDLVNSSRGIHSQTPSTINSQKEKNLNVNITNEDFMSNLKSNLSEEQYNNMDQKKLFEQFVLFQKFMSTQPNNNLTEINSNSNISDRQKNLEIFSDENLSNKDFEDVPKMPYDYIHQRKKSSGVFSNPNLINEFKRSGVNSFNTIEGTSNINSHAFKEALENVNINTNCNNENKPNIIKSNNSNNKEDKKAGFNKLKNNVRFNVSENNNRNVNTNLQESNNKFIENDLNNSNSDNNFSNKNKENLNSNKKENYNLPENNDNDNYEMDINKEKSPNKKYIKSSLTENEIDFIEKENTNIIKLKEINIQDSAIKAKVKSENLKISDIPQSKKSKYIDEDIVQKIISKKDEVKEDNKNDLNPRAKLTEIKSSFASNFDDIPIKSTNKNFEELLEKNLAEESINSPYDQQPQRNTSVNIKRNPRFKKEINISQPTKNAKAYKYYSDNFEAKNFINDTNEEKNNKNEVSEKEKNSIKNKTKSLEKFNTNANKGKFNKKNKDDSKINTSEYNLNSNSIISDNGNAHGKNKAKKKTVNYENPLRYFFNFI